MLYGDTLLKHDFLAFSMKFELKKNEIWKALSFRSWVGGERAVYGVTAMHFNCSIFAFPLLIVGKGKFWLSFSGFSSYTGFFQSKADYFKFFLLDCALSCYCKWHINLCAFFCMNLLMCTTDPPIFVFCLCFFYNKKQLRKIMWKRKEF